MDREPSGRLIVETLKEGGPAVKRVLLMLIGVTMPAGGAGCSLAPKSFRAMVHPAPIVRARAVGLGEDQPESVAVPLMIDRLADPDPVVRMTANDGLKERTSQDFGFKPWGSADERTAAEARWRDWWKARGGQPAYSRDDQLRKVSAQPARPARKSRRAMRKGQGGPTQSWPATPPASDPAS